MNNERPFFNDARPSDMRFENAHLLAEYITQARELIESGAILAKQIEASSNKFSDPFAELAEIANTIKAKHDSIIVIGNKLAVTVNQNRLDQVSVRKDFDAHIIATYEKLTIDKVAIEAARLELQNERSLFNSHVSRQLKKIRAAKNPESFWQRIKNVFNPIVYAKSSSEQVLKMYSLDPDVIPETKTNSSK